MSDKISILFDTYHLYHLPQFDPLIDLLAEDDRFEIFHSTSKLNTVKEQQLCAAILKNRPGTFISAKNETEREIKIHDLDLDVFICGWSRYDIDHFVTDKTLVGMVYHGIGVKPSYWLDNHERVDLRFVEGQYRMDQLRSYDTKADLALTGFIKLDPLFNGNITDFDPIKKALGLDPVKKTILFAPTFYPSSIERIGLRLGDYTRDYNVILKPHSWTYFMDNLGALDLEAQRNLFHDLANKYAHIRLLGPDQYNITPFYKFSDLLLTEASSTIYEMIALEKPVVVNRFFKLKLSHRLFRYRLHKKRLNREMNKDIADFCFEAKRHQDLPRVIETALNQNHVRRDAVRDYQRKMLFNLDGKAAERARDAILTRIRYRSKIHSKISVDTGSGIQGTAEEF